MQAADIFKLDDPQLQARFAAQFNAQAQINHTAQININDFTRGLNAAEEQQFRDLYDRILAERASQLRSSQMSAQGSAVANSAAMNSGMR
jgi:hypothetical protein